MKKMLSTVAIILAMFVSFSCSTPAYVQKDDGISLSDYKTYMWVDTRANENDESKRSTAFADISVRNAVNAQLRKWGWQEVSENPDAYISYDILVERTTETQRDPVYSQPFSRSYFNNRTKRWSTIYYPSQFVGYDVYSTPVREGTFTISIMDANTDKRIWQGWTTERLNNSGVSDIDIQKSVDNIFKQA